MGRDVPFDKDIKCDSCGSIGGFDFMGDTLCGTCASNYIAEAEKEAHELESQEIERQEIEATS